MKTNEAFRLIGLSPNWVGALGANPAELREFLKRYHRVAARAYHSDVARNPLIAEAGKINAAWEMLRGLDDEALAHAAKIYADSAAVSAEDLLAMMAQNRQPAPSRAPADGISDCQQALVNAKESARKFEESSFRFLSAVMVSGRRGYQIPQEAAGNGRRVELHQMRGLYFLAPFEYVRQYQQRKSEQPKLIERVIVQLGTVNEKDELLTKTWHIRPLKSGLSDAEVLDYTKREISLRLEKIKEKPVFTGRQNAGRLIGFTNSRVCQEMRYKIDGISSWLSPSLPISAGELTQKLEGVVSREDVYFTPQQRQVAGSHFLGLVALKTGTESQRPSSFICTIFGIGEIIG